MRHIQGKGLTTIEINRIADLLLTDLSISVIAYRMGCTSATINRINKQKRIRDYNGHHNSWVRYDQTLDETKTTVEMAH